MRKDVWWALLMALVLSVSAAANADEVTAPSAVAVDEAVAPAAGGMDEAAMAAWMNYSTPGDAHKVLEPLVGRWTHTVRWQMSPDAPPQESQGANVNEWILGGRFLKQTVTGAMDGQTFEGLGLTGYDNVRGEYASVWLDSMGTGIMISTGSYDSAARTIRESGDFSCPMTGEKYKTFRANWQFVDADHYTYEMYTTAPDGREFKSLEVTYQRQL